MIKLMSHLVANYPNPEISYAAAEALVKGGSDFLEIQLPFSDPSADGPVIQNACSTVLASGATTQNGLDFIAKLHKNFPNVKIAIMSYASLIFTPGIDNFCRKASEVGVNAMIIPDLPFDCDECLTSACKKYGMENIPVAAPSMTDERLQKMLGFGFKTIYAALRAGITGMDTKIDSHTVEFLKKLRQQNKSGIAPEIYGGFGIHGKEQAQAIAPYVEGVVAGSVFVRLIDSAAGDKKVLQDTICAKAKEIKGL